MENEREIMTRSKSMSPRYGPHFNLSHSLQLRLTHNDLPASPIVRLRFLSARPPPSDIYPPSPPSSSTGPPFGISTNSNQMNSNQEGK